MPDAKTPDANPKQMSQPKRKESRRIYISPTPQFDDKLAAYMERNGLKSKAQAIRTILHNVAVGRETKL